MKLKLMLALCAIATVVLAGEREDGLYISHVHRGGGKLERPDNTLETFLWCWGNGSALECDCRVTADGVGIMFHDNNLKRTPRGIPESWKKRKVSEMKWEELRDIDVGSYLDPQYASQRIPTIDATFAAMKGHPTYLCFVDEKGIGPTRIAAEARKYGVLDQVYYTGNSYSNIVQWNKDVPGGKSLLWIGAFPKTKTRLTDPVARAKMTEKTRAHFEKIMAEVRAADFKYITAVSIHTYWNPEDKVDPFILGTDYLKSLIDEFHAHGMKVCSIPFEGGDKEKVYHRLWELGCDGFSTDYPSVMFKVIRDLKAAAKK